jgi:hypothetical protein
MIFDFHGKPHVLFFSRAHNTSNRLFKCMAPAAQLAIRDACCRQPNLSLTRSIALKALLHFTQSQAIDACEQSDALALSQSSNQLQQ